MHVPISDYSLGQRYGQTQGAITDEYLAGECEYPLRNGAALVRSSSFWPCYREPGQTPEMVQQARQLMLHSDQPTSFVHRQLMPTDWDLQNRLQVSITKSCFWPISLEGLRRF